MVAPDNTRWRANLCWYQRSTSWPSGHKCRGLHWLLCQWKCLLDQRNDFRWTCIHITTGTSTILSTNRTWGIVTVTPWRRDNDNDHSSCHLSVHKAQTDLLGPWPVPCLAKHLQHAERICQGRASQASWPFEGNGPVSSSAWETCRGICQNDSGVQILTGDNTATIPTKFNIPSLVLSALCTQNSE